MPTFPFMQVDDFTTRPLGGNPCAIVFDCPIGNRHPGRIDHLTAKKAVRE